MAKEKGKKREAARREKFTDRGLRALEPAPKGEFYTVYDETKTGLAVRVTDQLPKSKETKAGSITFQFVGRFPGAKSSTRRTIGRFPAVSLADAKKQIEEWHTAIADGVDPVKVEAERLAREAAEKRESDGRRFEAIFELFIAARRKKNIRKVDEDEMDFRRECLPTTHKMNVGKKVKPVWEGRDASSLTMQADILPVLREIKKRGERKAAETLRKRKEADLTGKHLPPPRDGSRQVLNFAQKLGTFFEWAAKRDYIPFNPYKAVLVTDEFGEKKIRQRVLVHKFDEKDFDYSELIAFWKATEILKPAERDAYRALLISGQRLEDIAGLRWSEIDIVNSTITIPPVRDKMGRGHMVPITQMFRDILDSVERWDHCPYVFSVDGRYKVSLEDDEKKLIDERMLIELRDLKGDPDASFSHWVNHDLRRTVYTMLGELRVINEIRELVVGHASDDLIATYGVGYRLGERREALERWEAKLRSILGMPASESLVDNVVAFRA